MTVLAFETSCDETGAAVVRDGVVLANTISSQITLHAEYGGVVPELATREHLRNLPSLAKAAIETARVEWDHVDLVAATRGPGLPGALLVGLKAAQGLAFSRNIAFIGIHHHEAHLYSPWISGHPPRFDLASFSPNVSLIVSGGHTLLVHVRAPLDHKVLGETLDDAAGECFDKTARLVGLAYPGGPQLERMAEGGNARAFEFPRPLLDQANDHFSFSGLKTSVRYFVRDHPETLQNTKVRRDLCASVQAAIVEVLVTKTVRAAVRVGARAVTVSGGVASNRTLRGEIESACGKAGIVLRVAVPALCTDNAAMIGVLAELKARQGLPLTDLDADIEPGWSLGN